jgi:16S rRNA (cytosine967-C5)-methyltransferase
VYARLGDQAARFPDLDLSPLDTSGLDRRDAALAHAVYDAVLRRWLTLECVLDAALSKPMRLLEPPLRGVLLAGAAQLLLLDRIPPHAAIHESVELAKVLVRPRAAGLVNAALRRVASMRGAARPRWVGARDEIPLGDGRALALIEAQLPEGAAARLAAATSHPTWAVERWTHAQGADACRRVALHSLVPPPTLLNVAYTTDVPPETNPHQAAGFRVFLGTHERLVTLLDRRRDVWVQDPASAAVVRSLRACSGFRTPTRIVDVCAGLGTKTRQLAAEFPEASIIASDADASRLDVLRRVFHGSERVRVHSLDRLLTEVRGDADLALLDVPCSNTGVLARRVEAKYRVSADHLAQLVGVQRRIMERAGPLVRPGGLVLYSTCSLEHEENEAQLEWASAALGWKQEHQERRGCSGLPGEPSAVYSDGSFAGLLRIPN